ncbi:MAG: peptidoglycan DD-metalloendopeptidase family protein, partial [Patescibacteria group bacterium]
RLLLQESKESWLEVLLSSPTLASFWQRQVSLLQYGDRVEENRQELKGLKVALEHNELKVSAEREKLASLKEKLADEKTLADKEKANKDKLLKETNNKESNYKKLLADSVAKKQAFEKELFLFESQLKIAIDPSLLPTLGTKPLAWPVTDVYITQSFGVTADSKRLYKSGSHNGIDFRAPVGTPIRAAASGVVQGVGDTDTVCSRASYGKWVLLKHDNGLSTLYAHLSLIKVAPNQPVKVGDLIAYSGNTGYATGPHLHFTVYASQGVQIASRQSTVCAGTYTIPIADPKAYLNPMDYL